MNKKGKKMTDTHLRDKVTKLAPVNVRDAYLLIKQIKQPWFKAQALASIVRYSDTINVLKRSQEARKIAYECDDDYKKSAVRAWEIVALAECGFKDESKKSLNEAVNLSLNIEPLSSRSESLFLLFQASCYIDMKVAERLYERMKSLCPIDEHWRAKRAIKHAQEILDDKTKVRGFFW